MREISLDDDKIKSLTTYDTSGPYTDPSYKHNHNQGLKNIRTSWIESRDGILECSKEKLNFLEESKTVEKFPEVKSSVFKKKGK